MSDDAHTKQERPGFSAIQLTVKIVVAIALLAAATVVGIEIAPDHDKYMLIVILVLWLHIFRAEIARVSKSHGGAQAHQYVNCYEATLAFATAMGITYLIVSYVPGILNISMLVTGLIAGTVGGCSGVLSGLFTRSAVKRWRNRNAVDNRERREA